MPYLRFLHILKPLLFCHDRNSIVLHPPEYTEASSPVNEPPSCRLAVFGVLFGVFPRLAVTLTAFREHFHSIHNILWFSFFKYKPELPAYKMPSLQRHRMEIIGKRAALHISEISKNPFSILFHGTLSFLLSLRYSALNIEYRYFYFKYNIDTRYCQSQKEGAL